MVVGVLIWVILRRKRTALHQQEASETVPHTQLSNEEVYAYRKQQYTPPVHEVDAESSPRVEMDARQVSELAGHYNAK